MREIIYENKGYISQPAQYRAIPILKELGLVDEERLTNLPRRIVSLMEKGKQVVKMLRNINGLLEK
ncbi:MAG: hypothetical protein WED07_12785 [Candidatus Freyarchaeum deiterrae]